MVGASSNPDPFAGSSRSRADNFRAVNGTRRSWRAKSTCQFCLNRARRCGIRLNTSGATLEAVARKYRIRSSHFPSPPVFRQSSAGPFVSSLSDGELVVAWKALGRSFAREEKQTVIKPRKCARYPATTAKRPKPSACIVSLDMCRRQKTASRG
jgi:hypothetical protein